MITPTALLSYAWTIRLPSHSDGDGERKDRDFLLWIQLPSVTNL